jgi:hypothetical protein
MGGSCQHRVSRRRGLYFANTGCQFQPRWLWVEPRYGHFGFSRSGRTRGTWVEPRRKRPQRINRRSQFGSPCRFGLVIQRLKRVSIPTTLRCKRRCCHERSDTRPAPLKQPPSRQPPPRHRPAKLGPNYDTTLGQTRTRLGPSPKTQLGPNYLSPWFRDLSLLIKPKCFSLF